MTPHERLNTFCGNQLKAHRLANQDRPLWNETFVPLPLCC